MKLFIAGLATETNSFSPIPTGVRAFENTFVSRQATREAGNLFSAPLQTWRAMAESFAKGPTKAYGGAKRLLATAYQASMQEQLDKETESIAAMMATHDGPHGLKSFLMKQKPAFKGK